MSKTASKTITYIVFAVVGIGLLFFVFKDVDLSAMWNDIVNADFCWILVALAFAMAAYMFRAARWNLLIESTCEHRPSLKNAFWAEMFGYFANMALPRVGEITRCGALARTEKLPFDRLIGTVIVERVFDVLMMLLLAVVTFFIKIYFFGTFLVEKVIRPTLERFSSMSVVIAIAGISVVCLAVLLVLFKTRHTNVVSQKIVSFMQGMIDGVKSVYKLEKRWQFCIHTALLWLCYWAMTWAVCFALPPTAGLSAFDGLFLLIVGSIGMAVPVQGGIGAFHYIVALALTMYGFDFDSVGLLYATVSHESQMILEIVLGIASLFFVFKKKE